MNELKLAAAILVGMLVAACSSSTTSTPGGSATASPALADGKHYGEIKAVAVDPDSVTFDVEEYLTGQAATDAAVADGVIKPGESMPDDVYVRNTNKATTTLAVAPSVEVRILGLDGGAPTMKPVSFAEFAKRFKGNIAPRALGSLKEFGYWVTLTNGQVTAIEEQYHP